MKIIKTLSRHGVSKDFYNYTVRIPVPFLKELDWNEKTVVTWKKAGKKLVLEKE